MNSNVLTSFIANYYRPDDQGTLYQRLATFSKFIAEFNPGRKGIVSQAENFNYFITSLSKALQPQLGITSLPPVSSTSTQTCG